MISKPYETEIGKSGRLQFHCFHYMCSPFLYYLLLKFADYRIHFKLINSFFFLSHLLFKSVNVNIYFLTAIKVLSVAIFL